LNLCGEVAAEWLCYTTALRTAGISLNENSDELRWTGGDATGIISVKNLYNALIAQQAQEPDLSWFTRLWTWKIPLKQKLLFGLPGKARF
jgi:hypothetical protein